MPSYEYKARTSLGQILAGTLEAAGEDDVVKNLQSRGLIVIQVQDIRNLGGRSVTTVKRHKKVKGEDLLRFAREVATMLEAGVSFIRALEIVMPQVQSERLAVAGEAVKNDVRGGSSFKEAIEKHPKVFPPIWTHIIEAGEASGKLPLVLTELASSLERTEAIKTKVVSALIYPAVLMVVAMGAVVVFLVKIIPSFGGLYESLGAQLPLLTRIVLGFSKWLTRNLLFITIGCGGVGFLLKNYLATDAGKRKLDQLLLDMPVVGQLVRDAILARMSINLAIMLKSGVNFVKSLEITAKASDNSLFEQAMFQISKDVQSGSVLSEAMMKQPLFSVMISQMLTVGEEIGKIDDMLVKVGQYYEARVDVFVGRIGSLIEPVILVVVGAIIGVLVIAAFLPIISIGNLL